MLVVSFHAGDQPYALPAASVVEVVPRLPVRPIALAPSWVAGMARLRGEVLPIIDLVARLAGRPAAELISTRVAVVSLQVRGAARRAGLLVERLTGTSRVEPGEGFASLSIPGSPFLGEVVVDDGRLVQLVRPTFLVTPEMEAVLFAEIGA